MRAYRSGKAGSLLQAVVCFRPGHLQRHVSSIVKCVVLFLTLIFASQVVRAESILVDLKMMTSGVDAVALVQVTSGEITYGADGRICGGTYKARVRRAIKGAVEGSDITFGPYLGRKLGQEYFVFLARPGSRFDSSFAGSHYHSNPQLLREQRENCEARLPALRETYQGLGTISVEHGKLIGYRPAVRLSNGPYLLPSDLKGTREPGGLVSGSLFFGTLEVPADDFFEFINALASSPK